RGGPPKRSTRKAMLRSAQRSEGGGAKHPSPRIEGLELVSTLRRFRRLVLALDPAARALRTAVRRFASRIGPAERVLDLGSGDAPYAGFFPHRVYVTADLCSRAGVRCDATTLPFSDSVFD